MATEIKNWNKIEETFHLRERNATPRTVESTPYWLCLDYSHGNFYGKASENLYIRSFAQLFICTHAHTRIRIRAYLCYIHKNAN